MYENLVTNIGRTTINTLDLVTEINETSFVNKHQLLIYFQHLRIPTAR